MLALNNLFAVQGEYKNLQGEYTKLQKLTSYLSLSPTKYIHIRESKALLTLFDMGF